MQQTGNKFPGQWLYKPRPLPDELLSSWLIRVALDHSVIIRQFTRAVWPEISIWTRDIDVFAPDIIIKTMAEKCEVRLDEAFGTTLRSYEGLVFPYSGSGLTQFLLPIGVYHRVRKSPGQQWCPLCFISDKQRYWRRSWRLAFNTTCLEHGIILADRCQDCGTPVTIHKSLDFCCYRCNAQFDEHPCEPAKSTVLQLQGQLHYMMNGLTGDNYPFQLGMKHPTTFFRIIWSLFSMLSVGARSKQLRKTIEKHRGLQAMMDPVFASGNRFEDLGVNTRHLLTERLFYLLVGWPWMMIGYCQESEYLWSWIIKDNKSSGTPYELTSIADTFLSHHHVAARKGTGLQL